MRPDEPTDSGYIQRSRSALFSCRVVVVSVTSRSFDISGPFDIDIPGILRPDVPGPDCQLPCFTDLVPAVLVHSLHEVLNDMEFLEHRNRPWSPGFDHIDVRLPQVAADAFKLIGAFLVRFPCMARTTPWQPAALEIMAMDIGDRHMSSLAGHFIDTGMGHA